MATIQNTEHQYGFNIKKQNLATKSDAEKFLEGRNHFNAPNKTKQINIAKENWSNVPKRFADGINKEAYFDTQFKYQDFDEKQLVNRFLQWKRNRYIAFASVNKNMEFCNQAGETFWHANAALLKRFDELYPWQTILGDRDFFLHNHLDREYWNGRRYMYMIDKQLYDMECPADHKPRSIESKAWPGIRIMRDYAAFIELIEESRGDNNILVVGKEPWARLRYFIDQIELTYSDDFEALDEVNEDKVFPLEKFRTFLGFSTIKTNSQSFVTLTQEEQEELEDLPEETPELFSDFIKFSYSSSTKKRIAKRDAGKIGTEEHFQFTTIVKALQKSRK